MIEQSAATLSRAGPQHGGQDQWRRAGEEFGGSSLKPMSSDPMRSGFISAFFIPLASEVHTGSPASSVPQAWLSRVCGLFIP